MFHIMSSHIGHLGVHLGPFGVHLESIWHHFGLKVFVQKNIINLMKDRGHFGTLLVPYLHTFELFGATFVPKKFSSKVVFSDLHFKYCPEKNPWKTLQ